jgi:CrcB protein
MNRSIALFGALGAGIRYGISLLVPGTAFPLATLLVNLMGCFALSLVLTWVRACFRLPEFIVNGMSTGFIGAFTTFSAFSCDNAAFFLSGKFGYLAINVFVSLFGGLAAAMLGSWLGEKLCRKGKTA